MEREQDCVIAFLSDPATHGADVSAVQRIDTHISIIFLAGDRVFKLKRAVVLEFLDYGTPDKRRFYCERELVLNRRTAPAMYLGVRAIDRDTAGRLTIDGPGDAIDWVVEMMRFDADSLFGRQADVGQLTLDRVRQAADEITALHEIAEIVTDDRDGDEAGMSPTVAQLRGGLGGHADIFGMAAVTDYLNRITAVEQDQRELLSARFRAGWVRVCHGDLHLNNICMFDGRPTLFDAAEANDRFMRIDVLYDLAFLLMDLEMRGLRAQANAVLNRYAACCEAPRAALAGLRAMPLFLSLRAAIRAEVSVLTADNVAAVDARDHLGVARRYFDLARKVLVPVPAALVAVGGASGTGKTCLARAIAPDLGPAPGAVIVRSDEVRKSLFGVAYTDRLPETAYTEEWHRRTYTEVIARAQHALAAGHACIVDAVHGSPGERAGIEEVAAAADVPFHGVWLEAPADVLRARTAGRMGDASDAGPEVAMNQLRRGFGDVAWPSVDATGDIDAVSVRVRDILGTRMR
ncbi:MAG: AAA family ATPase [Rhodospirillaceae bacterium]|nr:AAA family ATPase [Rhodospirillaceae bacterium]